MNKPVPLPGQTIRYTMDGLGVVDSDEIVMPGDLGRYIGPNKDPGWHFTEPAKCPGHAVPVTMKMVEIA